MEYYSAIKRNKIECIVVRYIILESVIQSEVSQEEKNGGKALKKERPGFLSQPQHLPTLWPGQLLGAANPPRML